MRYKVKYKKTFLEGPKRGVKVDETIGFQKRHDVDAWMNAVQGAPIRDLKTNEYYTLSNFSIAAPNEDAIDVEYRDEFEDA